MEGDWEWQGDVPVLAGLMDLEEATETSSPGSSEHSPLFAPVQSPSEEVLGELGLEQVQPKRLPVEEIFKLLMRARNSEHVAIPFRPQASPIHPEVRIFFVKPDLKHQLTEKEKQQALGDASALIPVKYQGFANGEGWWSQEHDRRFGVVTRNMTRRARKEKGSSGDSQLHGFAGEWMTLVERKDFWTPVEKSMFRSLVVPGVPSIVQFWPTDEVTKIPRKLSQAPSSSSSSSKRKCEGLKKRRRPEIDEAPQETVLDGPVQILGDCVIGGTLDVKSMHVKGKLRLDGQLVTPPSVCDYAEFFLQLDSKEKIECGMVVQLRSPEQRVTLDTSGRGPLLVVSTSPSIAAGVPDNELVDCKGALCGFLGQVPTLVKGPVSAGDSLLPSGNNDGFCVSGDSRHVEREPVGTAMEDCGLGEHLINTFVRWSYDDRWGKRRERTNDLTSTIVFFWRFAVFVLFYLLYQFWICDASIYRAIIGGHLLFLVIGAVHFPVYPEFALRGDFWWGMLCISLDFMYTLWYLFNIVLAVPNEAEDVISRKEMRALVLQVLRCQIHIFFLIALTWLFLRARNVVLRLPNEGMRTRREWKKKIWKRLFAHRVF